MDGRAVIASPQRKSLRFELSLKVHSSERTVTLKILWCNAHEEGSVGVNPVPRELTHTVRAEHTRLTGGIDNRSSGTHTKRVGPSAVVSVNIHLVIGGSEVIVSREAAVLRFVNFFAEMLYAGADRERLRFHRKTLALQHFERVSRTVTDRENNAVGFNDLPTSVSLNNRGSNCSVRNMKAC